MQGKPVVIDALNRLLANELTAMDQYLIHSRMYDDWGYTKLFERIEHESLEEREHISILIERILFLEGTPDMATRDPIKVGHDVPSMLDNDLQVEYRVDDMLKETMQLCEKEQDYVTKKALQRLIDDTETDHAHWLEQQLRQIKLLGLEIYLQAQL
ncbi:bacterioferritin [Celerinatantimonas diazotrophica]|uniref:Bacterioferritin n=1 Tax=Celerinatantimonas diazotrophica TaxID=412034 RepID=A0A4R1J891_9GAMM|nr:bacterioferritin [Celerinatantimonas diazotrophica]TCK46772.1 bacterioferritin [Celerinatantimonas diazotrophica]CAG9295475.1 Bacterioferritin [Celerinatantimonas diazotrophica]